MAKKKKIDIKQVIADALEHYHNYVRPSIQESTKRQNESLLSEFYRFVDTLPARDKTMKIFSQKGLNRYKEYLIDKMERSKTDGKKRNFGVGQLNRCGSIIARLINNVLYPKEIVPNHVVWIKVEDTRRESQKGHIPLLDNEVTAIENCKGLTPVEEEYRNIFLLQIESGQRVSDLANILTGEYTLGQVDEYECIILATKKEDVPAAVVLTPKVRMLLERIKTHKHVDPKKFKEKADSKGNNTYNEAIRRIAKKAGLDRIIVKIDTNKIVEKKPLYKVITNHDARSTFITNKIRTGMTPDEIAVFTGHANGEMIRRVYAQPTIEDKLRNVKQYLSGGDKDTEKPNTVSSDKSKELEADSQDVPGMEPDSLPKNNYMNPDSSDQFKLKDYIKGLNNFANSTIGEMEMMLNELLHLFLEMNTMFEMGYNEIKSEIIKKGINSSEGVLKSWSDILEYCEELNDNFADDIKGSEDIYKVIFLRVMMDYCKENHLGEELIRIIERLYTELNEENPALCLLYNCVNLDKELFQAFLAMGVSIKVILYIFQNRPKVASLLIKADKSHFTLIKDYDFSLVVNELNIIPKIELQAIIKNTNLDYDIRTKLYRSIVNSDLEHFADIVKSSEHELRGLIELAYQMNFLSELEKLITKLFDNLKEDSNPIDDSANLDEFLLLNNPFSDYDISPYENSAYDATFEETMLCWLDTYMEMLETFKNIALPEEKRIINKILRLVDQHPKLIDAYNDYKVKKQLASSSDKNTLVPHSGENVSIEGKAVKKQKVGTNYITFNSENIDIDKLIRLLTEKDKLNKYHQFITVLESTDNVNVATCLKHFLGTHSNTPLSFRLNWNGHTKASLKFLIRLITNTNEEASRLNVIDESEYDGISHEYVSQWTGSGELWTPVCNVFGGSTGYMMSVGLGKEGEKRRIINLEQYNTIADIYFECKLKC